MEFDEKEEIKRLRRYEQLVKMIDQEPNELSWEKIMNQRDWWKRCASKLVKDDATAASLYSKKPSLDDNF